METRPPDTLRSPYTREELRALPFKGADVLRRWPEIHTDDDGHMTLICHCARCEAERRWDKHVESLVTPPNEEEEP